MYQLTGLPGWMRFGFSPGWIGRSPTGLGPCASFMMTGQWPTPQAQAYWQAMQAGQAPYPYYGGTWAMTPPAFMPAGTQAGFAPGMPPTGFAPGVQPGGAPGLTEEQELQMLGNQSQMLSQQLEQINNRIKELEEKG